MASRPTEDIPRSEASAGDGPDGPEVMQEGKEDQISSNLPPAGPATPQRPHELRELSSEVPREPSWPSEGPTWRNAEAVTPTSISSDKAAAGASQQTTAQGSHLGNTAAWDAASPNSKADSPQAEEQSVTTKKCTPKNPFWIQPEVPQKKSAQGSCESNFLSGAAPLRCLSDVVDAGDRNEIDIAEEDLTTVHISSWEQRLDWRSFLSEAVAASLARQAFMNFDVEAEPPSYARPPPSARSAGSNPAGDGRAGPRCVAPEGSGWLQNERVSLLSSPTKGKAAK
ncbi:unnamed protein product [Durusdinium trenchii]|uniref:Uncharacterized protein n=1 Tax=Durusdinium trenchii TaxID=1381693 RepID=A0ABP0QIY6_9DINO